MTAYYNEIDPYVAQWLRNLIAENLIAPGDVDERSITDVRPADLAGYAQCHFFAGIAGWSRALRLAGWPDDRPVWTGSSPCQAFSGAARGRTVAADMWPEFYRLIIAGRPATLFGEQVPHAKDWFDGVCDDLETLDYEIGAAILPACSVGQDHARPRIYFVGHANGDGQSSVQVDAKMARLSRHRSDGIRMVPSNGLSGDMARFSAFGNAILPEIGAGFIGAFLKIDGR